MKGLIFVLVVVSISATCMAGEQSVVVPQAAPVQATAVVQQQPCYVQQVAVAYAIPTYTVAVVAQAAPAAVQAQVNCVGCVQPVAVAAAPVPVAVYKETWKSKWARRKAARKKLANVNVAVAQPVGVAVVPQTAALGLEE